MRDLNDLRTVRFNWIGTFQLDLERVENDPLWETAANGQDLSTEEGYKSALASYCAFYLQQETILAGMPSTNGPATPVGIQVEVFDARSNS